MGRGHNNSPMGSCQVRCHHLPCLLAALFHCECRLLSQKLSPEQFCHDKKRRQSEDSDHWAEPRPRGTKGAVRGHPMRQELRKWLPSTRSSGINQVLRRGASRACGWGSVGTYPQPPGLPLPSGGCHGLPRTGCPAQETQRHLFSLHATLSLFLEAMFENSKRKGTPKKKAGVPSCQPLGRPRHRKTADASGARSRLWLPPAEAVR